MNTIQIKDKRFAISIPEEDILREVDRVAKEINRDLETFRITGSEMKTEWEGNKL